MHISGYVETLNEEYLISENLNIIEKRFEKNHTENRKSVIFKSQVVNQYDYL